MQKIIPYLWFDKQAEEAAKFYADVFDNGKVTATTQYPDAGRDIHGQSPGQVMTVEFELAGYQFLALNAGPMFTFNPSISFFLNFDPSRDENAAENLDKYWDKLVDGGKVLIEKGEHPFSKKYGWLQDKFGVTWQLILTNPEGEPRPFIVPSLMFTQDKLGKAEEAMNFYTSVFHDAKVSSNVNHYPAEMPDRAGMLAYGDFTLENQWFAAMDTGVDQDFTFNEAISLLVQCETQEEIDYYWEKLSADPDAERCGWLKDKYGVSWQIAPAGFAEMYKGDPDKAERAFRAMMQMKKLDIDKLKNS